MERPIASGIVFAFFLITMWFPLKKLNLTVTKEPKKTVATVRECKPGSDTPRKEKTRKGHNENLPTAFSCIEVKEPGLPVQEYLQKLVRDLGWSIGDEQVSEDLWSFSIYLSAEDTVAYTKPLSDPKVTWSGGKALVNLWTTELQDGFTRITATAKFDGYGTQQDQFAPKRSSWPLPSNGKLETKIADSLKARFQAAH